jgi:predicted PurR-regulated permease PerM
MDENYSTHLSEGEQRKSPRNYILDRDSILQLHQGMAIVYLVVGILNSIGLLLLGIPHAILFGFIAAVLTFIPYFGIMVGSLLP